MRGVAEDGDAVVGVGWCGGVVPHCPEGGFGRGEDELGVKFVLASENERLFCVH